MHICCCLVTQSCPTLVTTWIVARQAHLSMGFPRREYWSGLPFPPPGNLPDPGIKLSSPALQVDSLPAEPSRSSINIQIYMYMGLPRWLSGKEAACQSGDTGLIFGSGRTPGKGKGIAWKLPWTEERGGLLYKGWQSHNPVSKHTAHTWMFIRRNWLTWLRILRIPTVCSLQAGDPRELVL